ncbi:DUF3097 family protein [Micrococcoides hystricis]|uniref:DUF3097 family protein n=1 Tax=Micrococcoides hystricis TaxID=1572761 RepID=A0ABV6P7D6_9MICC
MNTQWGPSDLGDLRAGQGRQIRQQPAESGLVIEETESGWVGAILRVEKAGGMHVVVLEDRHGKTRSFPLGFGFLLEGEPVELTPSATPKAPRPSTSNRTASGSRARSSQQATVARAAKFWVEGTHDAELVEKIWGEDLRELGIAVEPIGGIDDLPAMIQAFGPHRQARLAVLVDHLVPGSKETRIVEQVRANRQWADTVLVLGHPYVDVWQSVKPKALGIAAWPSIDRSVEWKRGVLQAFGLPHGNQRDIAHGWKLILARVRNYADLEPSFLGRVEELIDFLTQDDEDRYA